MSSKRELKKDINFVYEELIGAVYLKELSSGARSVESTEALIDKIIVSFDGIIAKVNAKNVEDVKSHFRTIRKELENATAGLIDEINK